MKKIILASLLVATVATTAFAGVKAIAVKSSDNNVLTSIVITNDAGKEVTCAYEPASRTADGEWNCSGQGIASVVLTTNAGGTATATAGTSSSNWTVAFAPRTPVVKGP